MSGKTILLAGVYGTGKSTLCSALTTKLGIPSFSASDLISQANSESYGRNKAVTDADANQHILSKLVKDLNKQHGLILLAGHFCIFRKDMSVEVLTDSVFEKLNLKRIILLETTAEIIVTHLSDRDSRYYTIESISRLLERERSQAIKISTQLMCPLDINSMSFSDHDVFNVAEFITRGA